MQTQIYIKKHSPSSQVIQNQKEKSTIDLVKKIKIYKNKSGAMIDKRKPSVISIKTNVNNDNIICNKHPQQKNIGSILKNSFNNTCINLL